MILNTAQEIADINVNSFVRMQSNSIKGKDRIKHTWDLTTPSARLTALYIVLNNYTFYDS
jgi:hypothetical protein